MTKQTYHGSCQCGRVKYEADIDFTTTPTHKCNCTICTKRRWWSVKVETGDFRLLQGAEFITPTQGKAGDAFCTHCGITPFMEVAAADWNDGAYISVNVASIDDVEPETLINAPKVFFDGLHNNWWNPPAEIRHL